MRERYLHRCREQSIAIRAYAKSAVGEQSIAICVLAMSAVGKDVVSIRFYKLFANRVVSAVRIDVVSSHMKYCRIPVGITR